MTQHPSLNADNHAAAMAHASGAISHDAKQTAAATPALPAVNAYAVGWLFVQEYYTFLNKNPTKLHCFYNSKSSFLHGTEGDSLDTQEGVKAIQARILELDFQDCKVLVSHVDSQKSFGGCIVTMVLGEMSNRGGESHKFCQCFVLAEQPSGYFVYNDMFRFLKEDIQEEYDEPVDPMSENEYYHSLNQQQILQQSYHSNQLEASIPAVPVAATIATPPPAAQRARSPSPAKKQPTPTPAAASVVTAPVAEAAPARARTPSPAKKEAAKPSPAAPAAAPLAKASTTPAKKEEEVVGSWAESVPTPPTTAGTIKPVDAPSSAVQATSPTRNGNGKKKPAASKEPSSASLPPAVAAAPAQPPKPTTWAGLAAASLPPSDKPAPMSSKPSSDNLKARPVSQQGVKANGSSVAAPMVIKKVPNHPQVPPANEQVDDFREVQRGRGGDRRTGPSSGNRNFKEPESYSRSIFFMIPDGLDEETIREVFTRLAGPVVEVTIPKNKPLCFVEFEDAAVAQSAIGKPVQIGGKTITPEPRKPKPQTGYQGQQYQGQGQRGGYQGNRGGYNSQRGGNGGSRQQNGQQQQHQNKGNAAVTV
ncbi:hypothetical protein BJ741DRAFT_543621 [Chytriomyces cf. hyalinus JEL632]|nr:hypothetical protein BJ741DRAFT_543621 [Chytriomyces cf. hyalinus JEL632]